MGIRPGFTFEIQNAPKRAVGKRGTVTFFYTWAMLPYGMHEITEDTDLYSIMEGYDYNMQQNIKAMLKNCKSVLVYQPQSATQSTGNLTLGEESVTLRTVASGQATASIVLKIVADGDAFNAIVKVAGNPLAQYRGLRTLRDLQAASKEYILVSDLADTSKPLEETTVQFAGGSSASNSLDTYKEYLAKLKEYAFDMVVVPKQSSNEWVNETYKTLRDIRELDEVECHMLTFEHTTSEFWNICVKQVGANYKSRELESMNILASRYVALEPNVSAMRMEIPEYQGVYPILSNRDLEDCIRRGVIGMFKDAKGVVRLDDEVTCYLGDNHEIPECLSRGQSVRIVEDIIKKSRELFNTHYLGKVACTEARATQFKADILSMLLDAQKAEIVKEVVAEDVEVRITDRNQFEVVVSLFTVEAVRKAEFTFKVR